MYCGQVLKQGRVRLRGPLCQGFTGWDTVLSCWPSTECEGSPARVLLSPGCTRGRVAPALAPLPHPSMGWWPRLALFPGASLLLMKPRYWKIALMGHPGAISPPSKCSPFLPWHGSVSTCPFVLPQAPGGLSLFNSHRG